MREIKFRAWDKRKKEMLKPNYGFPVLNFNGEILGIDTNYNLYMVKDLILMQYTGLKDKNGVEIYEGDILQNNYEESIVSVIWDLTGANWQFREHKLFMDDGAGRGDWGFNMGYAKQSEVIGNIYENPELVKGGTK